MNILQGTIKSIQALTRANPEDPSTSLSNPASFLFGPSPAHAGVSVDEKSSLSLSAVWAANRVISESVGQLPLKVYKKQERGKLEQRDHPLFNKLQNAPNANMTSSVLRETMQTSLNLWGNAYGMLKRDSGFRATSIVPLEPWKIEVKKNNAGTRLIYEHKDMKDPIEDINMIHIPGISFNGLVGKSPIQATREAISNAKAAQQYGNDFYANGATPAGVLQTDNELNPEQIQTVKTSWNEAHQGQKHSTAVLPYGLQYSKIEIPPNDAQWIESRQFGVKEIARVFNIPPHKLQDLENANYSNIVEQDLAFVKYTLNPHLKKWEQELNRKMLTEKEKKEGYFIEFDTRALLRGDPMTRAKYYKALAQIQVLTPNEIRELENLNPIDGADDPLPVQNDPSGNTDPKEE